MGMTYWLSLDRFLHLCREVQNATLHYRKKVFVYVWMNLYVSETCNRATPSEGGA